MGHRLVSGSRDTSVIVWDVINESGLYRLQGHKGPVTNVAFMPTTRNQRSRNVVVSSSKDTFVKFWDLNVQHCFKTLTGHLTEVWDFAIIKVNATKQNKDGVYLVTGTSDSELRVWKLNFKEGALDDASITTAKNEQEIEPNFKIVSFRGNCLVLLA